MFRFIEFGLEVIHFLLDNYGADQILLHLLGFSITPVNKFLHAIIAAKFLHLLRANFFLFASEGGKQTEQMLPVLILFLFGELLLLLLVVNRQGFNVAAFSIVVHYSSNIIQKDSTIPFPNIPILSYKYSISNDNILV